MKNHDALVMLVEFVEGLIAGDLTSPDAYPALQDACDTVDELRYRYFDDARGDDEGADEGAGELPELGEPQEDDVEALIDRVMGRDDGGYDRLHDLLRFACRYMEPAVFEKFIADANAQEDADDVDEDQEERG